jgi:hypothetical protein
VTPGTLGSRRLDKAAIYVALRFLESARAFIGVIGGLRNVSSEFIIVVNTATADQRTNLALRAVDADSRRMDLLTGEAFAARGTVLGSITLDTGTGSLRILHRSG